MSTRLALGSRQFTSYMFSLVTLNYRIYNGHLMIVKVERAKLPSRQPLGLISSSRKRKHRACQEKQLEGSDVFAAEFRSVM
ncbi:hypothetical protein F4777DRAFT_572001 [Nemania sp. FL0916]|nr:hypothetical protein F4777DRAFT_572001 [Nemania sp. FL0916]